jgi:hypothetical protein
LTATVRSFGPTEPPVELRHRIAAGDLVDVRVDLLPSDNVRMAEDDLRVPGRDAEGL